MKVSDFRQHEVSFCSEVSKWADHWFELHPDLPFGSSHIESFARGSQKRSDLRFYARKASGRGRLELCAEVKLPGSAHGRSPFDPALLEDAYQKATVENCRYFFTWNVEEMALFDRSIWDAASMHERCVGHWKLGERLSSPSDVSRPEIQYKIFQQFLPRVFNDLRDIWAGKSKGDFSLAPSDFYIAVLESHLAGPMGPVRELRDYLAVESGKNKIFDARLRAWMIEQQWNFDRKDAESWKQAIERAARSMVYVLSNRILFYQAVRLRNSLPELRIPKSAKTPEKTLAYLQNSFAEAVEMTGDYEPVFFPDRDDKEWAALTTLSGTNSIESWQKVIEAVDRFHFKEIPTDVLGGVFQKLIGPEERHKFGQHYTDENIVDVINAFCIQAGDAAVLDPACGSGGFLVRAYYRKLHLDAGLRNHELLEGLYGCDINPFPAHLATLNLAARNITNEENYPRVVRKNFFAVGRGEGFCELPKATRGRDGQREKEVIALPPLDAIVGNPPYVRHELIPKAKERGTEREQSKEHLQGAVKQSFPDLELSGQSDLHVYFWPVAAQLLKEGGWFGFLTSSSWLDVRYGFALQRWALLNFKLIAVIESMNEPWFEDARVKTAATIMQRCSERSKRDENLVRFVRCKRPLAEILGEREDERQKQEAAERLRDLILRTKSDFSNDELRIMVKKQKELWNEGLSIAEMFARQKSLSAEALEESGGEEEQDEEESATKHGKAAHGASAIVLSGDYGGGKWGRYLRAPDFYFEIMREFGRRFTRLGDVATIKRGITSGCDAFFMPREVSAELLAKNESELRWPSLPLMQGCKRKEVESGKVVIIQAGDGTLHPIEKEFIRPEVHSLMKIDRPVVNPESLDRVVLWVSQPLKEIKGTYAHDYISWGSKQTFASKKSKAVPAPERASCAGREPWYDVTGLVPGIAFWPMTHKYRHIIPANPKRIPCNHRLFDIHSLKLKPHEEIALVAILNSTIVALLKHFYGRYAGSEGTLDTEVFETLMLEIPSPQGVSPELCERLRQALEKICEREVTHLVEQSFLDCHSEEQMRRLQKEPLGLPLELQRKDRRDLDLLVFELLGVDDAERREELVERLYLQTALYHREQRIQDIRSNINRTKSGAGKDASQLELALDAWNDLEAEWQQPLAAWLKDSSGIAKIIDLPEGEVRLPAAANFFEATTLYFGKRPAISRVCGSREEAELLYAIASEGVRGPVAIPASECECRRLRESLEERLVEGRGRLMQLAEERAGAEKLREQVMEILHRWFIHGKTKAAAQAG